MTYLFEGLCEGDALGVDHVLGQLRLCLACRVEIYTRLHDGVRAVEHLKVLHGAYAPVKVDESWDNIGVLGQEGGEVGDGWRGLLLGSGSELCEAVSGRGEETAEVVAGSGGLEGEAHNEVGVLDQALHLVKMCCFGLVGLQASSFQ